MQHGVTEFCVPAGSRSTLSVAVSSFAASDDYGVTGYCLTENATSTGCAWNSTPASSYHFSTIGTHTLNAFAKDAAGNVSAPASATVDIPVIVPRITTFIIPPTYSYDNPTIPVTFTASDDLGVTGYCLTEATISDNCSWTGSAPSSYTFATLGRHTLYAFAKNSSGQVSPAATASTTVVGQINFIPAANRIDMVYDKVRDVLYITNGTQVLRYKMETNSFLTPYTFGLGNLYGVDLSPDGNTLAIADRNITGVHLVDLTTDTVKPDVKWSPYISGEGGTFSVAFGNDGALLTTSSYNGSGWAPLRRVDTATSAVSIVKTLVSQDAMLSASADGTCIGYVEGNISSGPLSIYDVATQKVTSTVSSNSFTYEVGTNRDCSQFAVPTYGGTFLYDKLLNKLGTIGTSAAGQPIGVAYNPKADVVYFAWAGSSEIRVFNTSTLVQIGTYNAGSLFQSNGNRAYNQGRLKISVDASLLFATVVGGVHYQRLASVVADNQTVSGYADTALPITLTGSSAQNNALTYAIVVPPAHGSLQGTAPNLVYTPDPSYSGTDTVVFKVNDGTANSANATLTITLKPVPTAVTIAPASAKGQLTLNWTDPTGMSFSSISIYRSTNAGSLGSLIASNIYSTAYTDQGLASQTTYYYTVRIVDASGKESKNTAQAAGTTLDSVAPITTATPSSGSYNSVQQVTLSASEPATIYYSTDGTDPTTSSLQYNGPITPSARLRCLSSLQSTPREMPRA